MVPLFPTADVLGPAPPNGEQVAGAGWRGHGLEGDAVVVQHGPLVAHHEDVIGAAAPDRLEGLSGGAALGASLATGEVHHGATGTHGEGLAVGRHPDAVEDVRVDQPLAAKSRRAAHAGGLAGRRGAVGR